MLDEGDAQKLLVEGVLMAEHVVLAELFPVIAGDDNDRVVELPSGVEGADQVLEKTVELCDASVEASRINSISSGPSPPTRKVCSQSERFEKSIARKRST